MEDMRYFIEELGGKDVLWKIREGNAGDWQPVSTCALSVPLTRKPDRRVIFIESDPLNP